LPGWQAIYQQLKDKNFEIVSVAQDTNGVKDAGPWITAANPAYTALIDEYGSTNTAKLFGLTRSRLSTTGSRTSAAWIPLLT